MERWERLAVERVSKLCPPTGRLSQPVTTGAEGETFVALRGPLQRHEAAERAKAERGSQLGSFIAVTHDPTVALIEHYDGSKWSVVPSPNVGPNCANQSN
jgi:hypothetical protein